MGTKRREYVLDDEIVDTIENLAKTYKTKNSEIISMLVKKNGIALEDRVNKLENYIEQIQSMHSEIAKTYGKFNITMDRLDELLNK